MSDILETASPVGTRMGEGNPPAELDRLNWSTVMWGGLWFIVYGAWRWFLIVTVWIVVGVAAALFVDRAAGPESAPALVLAVVWQLVWYAIVIAAAYRANRHVWTRERKRFERAADQPVPRGAMLVAQYLKSQKQWAQFGLVLFGLQMGWTLLERSGQPSFASQMAPALTSLACLAALYLFELIRSRRRPRS